MYYEENQQSQNFFFDESKNIWIFYDKNWVQF